jgi:5'-deoxynucleotidase YfbR-like HD superfamily hydrolase
LESSGIKCWIASQNIDGGESFAEQIVDAIYDCFAFVMIASGNSDESPHVSNEISLATTAKKKIIPFKIQEYQLSKKNLYFFQHAQWIDASENLNDALKNLIKSVRRLLPAEEIEQNCQTIEALKAQPEAKKEEKKEEKREEKKEEDNIPSFTREEIVNILLSKIEKFPYCLKDRTRGASYDAFKEKAKVLFGNTLTMYFKGRLTAGGLDYIDMIVDTLSHGQGISIHVKGLPGCAKNMLLQLAYYKMLENFRSGECDSLPVYLSSSYYEKQPYSKENARAEMTALISEELSEYFGYLKKNPNVRPVLMVEAVREHIVSDFAPDDVIMDLWAKFGKFNRIVAVDVGLIKNRLRLKRTIPLMGDSSGYTFQFRSVPVSDKLACLTVIRTVLDMYIEKYDGLEEGNVYKALDRLGFNSLDVFNIRLVATELSLGRSVDDISLIDMYERLALSELKGDDEKMLTIGSELFEYVFNERHNVKTKQYNAVLWSLPHKHNTYLEFMIAYYFCHCVENYRGDENFRFFSMVMTPMGNNFVKSMLSDNYPLQETLLKLVLENYDKFDIFQKSGAMYWLGKLTYANLTDKAATLLESEYKRLYPIVKNNTESTLANRCNQYLLRSVSMGLISYGDTKVLDEYLCLLVINDVANSVNRGVMVQYLGESSLINTHCDIYLDSELKVGEEAIRVLCSRVETKLSTKRVGYIEMDMMSLLTLVQARMHTIPEKFPYNLMPYCEKCLVMLEKYQKRPRSIVSDKLFYYFESVCDDLKVYVDNARFDAAFSLYSELAKMKDTKRVQWLKFGIDDPESIAEHSLSAWMMAMIFLPGECGDKTYNKQEILDMLLIHDMAEAILGDSVSELSEPTRELENHNSLIRKLFLKGTYPEVANMTYYYNIWTGYFKGQNINARIARDINLIQTVNTFYTYFVQNPDKISLETVKEWAAEGNKLSTEIGCDLFERIVLHNPIYRKAIDNEITKKYQS